jgi:hypothetical protein
VKIAFVIAPVAALLACSSPNNPAALSTPPVNPRVILDRFTRDIWPAVAAFNADPEPIHKPYAALATLMADNSIGPSIRLYNEAGDLGYPPENDRGGAETMAGNDGLHLHAVDVQKIQGDTADLNVCYTYTHYWSVRRNGTLGDSQHAPGTSAATFGLYSRGGTWTLHSIINDHVVANCSSDKA